MDCANLTNAANICASHDRPRFVCLMPPCQVSAQHQAWWECGFIVIAFHKQSGNGIPWLEACSLLRPRDLSILEQFSSLLVPGLFSISRAASHSVLWQVGLGMGHVIQVLIEQTNSCFSGNNPGISRPCLEWQECTCAPTPRRSRWVAKPSADCDQLFCCLCVFCVFVLPLPRVPICQIVHREEKRSNS